jgi:RND superfamily putative drug exporter
LSGAGWEASGSESVQARGQIDANFAGGGSYALQVVVSSETLDVDDSQFSSSLAEAEKILASDERVSDVTAPSAGTSISQNRHTAILVGGAAAPPDEMVRAADDHKDSLSKGAAPGVTTERAGAAGRWSDFNEANKSAMLKSELISWPVTLLIL